MAKRSPFNLAPGPRGWCHVDWGAGQAWVRMEKDEHNKLTRLAELRVLDPSPESLRRIPLSRIQTAIVANGPAQLMLAIGLNAEELPEMFSAFSAKGMDEPRRYRLRRPARRRLDDGFYANVARAYRDATIRGLNPRQTIAADTGAAPDTVAGWVMEARRRGHLPPARPGKVSA